MVNSEMIKDTLLLDNIVSYLRENKWNFKKQIPDIASIWTKKIDGKDFNALLPLDTTIDDFDIKIDELFNLLSRVDNKPKEEIVKVFENISSFAGKIGRDVLDIRIKSNLNNKSEVSIEEIGLVLRSLQELVYQVGKSFNCQDDIKKDLKLSLVDTYKGSFGFRLASPETRQLQLLDSPLIEISLEKLLELIRAC